MHDAVVIGASIAGMATAIHLARRGRSVLVLERSASPARKACGEGLFPYGVTELRRLGAFEAIWTNAVLLHELRFHAGGDSASASLGPSPGLGVRRGAIEAVLQEVALGLGVVIHTGVNVTGLRVSHGRIAAVTAPGGECRARAFVAADGLNSRMRRFAGLESRRRGARFGVSAHVDLGEPAGSAIDVFYHGGYEVYRTPVGATEVNIALLLEGRHMRRFAGRLGPRFREILDGHPAVRGPFTLQDAPIAAGPFPRSCSRAWRGNLVLVGDAAGFFDGISGDGMSSALLTGRLAAAAADRFLATGSYDPFREYETARRAQGRASNLLARVNLAYARRPAAARLGVRNMARHPDTFARLVAVAAAGAPLRSIRPRDIAALALGI